MEEAKPAMEKPARQNSKCGHCWLRADRPVRALKSLDEVFVQNLKS
jgi:hypothetical protein